MKRLIDAVGVTALLLIGVFAAVQAQACFTRSQIEKRLFAKANPCPATGKPIPSCPGYVIDHVEPLCARGKDRASNMQWQTLADSIVKDGRERAYCACIKQHGKANCAFHP